MPELKTDWTFPLLDTTLDKRLERPGVQRGFSSEMTGVDGQNDGGLKPFSGFRQVYTVDQLASQTNHGIESEILDFKAIDFRIGSEHYGYGFVYRALRSSGSSCDVFIDYWDSATESWTKCTKLMEDVSSSAQFSVQVAGRFVYTFVTGRTPGLFYIEASRTKEYEAEADSWIDSSNATTNHGSDATLQVRNTTHEERSLFRFNTASEANKTVESATLNLTISGNELASAGVLTFNPVTDPSSHGDWVEAQTTWNIRYTGRAWFTSGGDYNAASQTLSVGVGFLGRVSLDLKTIVQGCLNSTYNPSSDKVDLIVRSNSAPKVYFASRGQANESIRPRLSVTYTDAVFLTPIVVGLTPTGSVPGPGKQPGLTSPERGISAGSFTTLDEGRPASAQVVLVTENPYTNENNFPDQVSGLCSGTFNDTFPPSSSPVVPGSPPSYGPPSAGSCAVAPDGITSSGLVIQLLTPANRQTGVSVTPKLDWTAYYPDGGAISTNMKFDVMLVQDGEGTLSTHVVAEGLAYNVTSFEPASLWPTGKMPYGKEFLWQVRARREDCDDFSVSSITATFTTENKYLARKFEPGDYSFGYVLVDSKTGRKSAFSQVAQVRSEDFLVGRIQNGATISSKKDQYMGVEIVYDSSKYDLMYVYRSIKIQDAGGTMIAGIPFLDAVVRLEDYQTCRNGTGRTFDPASTDSRHAMYFYELEDKQLVYQTPYVDRSVFDEGMPFGGAAMFYQNTMLVSKIENPLQSTTDEDRIDDPHRGLGEMRWSSLMEISPELFPPFNRYNPTVPSNEVIVFSKVGSNVLGLSRDKVYHIRKSGPYIKVTEMHEGYGIMNHRAVDSVGSSAFFVTSHGLKSVDTQGQLDEIRALNNVFVNEWAEDLLSVQVAYDPFMNCLFIHNPVQEESYVLWFSTSKITKVADSDFDLVCQGSWPVNFTGSQYSNELCRRAFFLQNNRETRASGTGLNSYPGPRIYIVDQDETRVISSGSSGWNGARRVTTLPITGDSRFVATTAFSGGSIAFSSGTTVVPLNGWQFAYMYLVKSVNKANIGRKAKILYNTTTGVYVDSAVDTWVTQVVAGDVFVVSPVYFEWAGHPIGMETEQGMRFSNADMFRMKVASSVGASFSDVTGPPSTDTAVPTTNYYTAILYSGTAETPMATSRTIDQAGNLYASIEDDEGVVYAAFGSDASDGRYGAKGTILTPGIRIICSDLDFRLLGCIVRGTITNVERSTSIRGS
jgi:hypothetical protein